MAIVHDGRGCGSEPAQVELIKTYFKPCADVGFMVFATTSLNGSDFRAVIKHAGCWGVRSSVLRTVYGFTIGINRSYLLGFCSHFSGVAMNGYSGGAGQKTDRLEILGTGDYRGDCHDMILVRSLVFVQTVHALFILLVRVTAYYFSRSYTIVATSIRAETI